MNRLEKRAMLRKYATAARLVLAKRAMYKKADLSEAELDASNYAILNALYQQERESNPGTVRFTRSPEVPENFDTLPRDQRNAVIQSIIDNGRGFKPGVPVQPSIEEWRDRISGFTAPNLYDKGRLYNKRGLMKKPSNMRFVPDPVNLGNYKGIPSSRYAIEDDVLYYPGQDIDYMNSAVHAPMHAKLKHDQAARRKQQAAAQAAKQKQQAATQAAIKEQQPALPATMTPGNPAYADPNKPYVEPPAASIPAPASAPAATNPAPDATNPAPAATNPAPATTADKPASQDSNK